MRSLVSLLEGAVTRSASEVTFESGQPVVYTTVRGTEAESSVLPRTELFDMIVAAVDDAQQVELAVGNPVEFTLDAGVSWSVYAEPGKDGITVHARREGGAAPDLEIDLDYSVGGPGGAGDMPPPPPPGFDFDEPQFDVGLESSSPRSSGPRRPGSSQPSQLHVAALEAPVVSALEDSSNSMSMLGKDAPAAPFESGTWALDDEEFEVGLDDHPDEDSLPTGFGDPPSFSDVPPAPSGYIGVPDDDDGDFDPFAEPVAAPAPAVERRHTLSPTVRAMDASPSPGRLKPPSAPRSPGTGANEGANEGGTLREVSAVRSPDADTMRELPSVGAGQPSLDELAADIGEGTLVYVREPGFAEVLARSVQAPSVTIEDARDAAWREIRELPPGAIVIVRVEDPSLLLGGILRRLEEGYRVFVETRAKTAEGARRVLLGVSASDRAERWLDAQVVLTIEPGEGGPRLMPS